jgi:hypothetical protein
MAVEIDLQKKRLVSGPCCAADSETPKSHEAVRKRLSEFI